MKINNKKDYSKKSKFYKTNNEIKIQKNLKNNDLENIVIHHNQFPEEQKEGF